MTTLSAAARDALQYAVADQDSIRLPVITARKIYVEVDRALSRIAGGGRWDRRQRAHVYTRDPRPDLQQLTGTAVIPPPCPTRDKELSYWATPEPLAQLLVVGLNLEPGMRVLEPSAGDGALVRALRAVYPPALVHITAVEPDRARRTVLLTNGTEGLNTWCGTLETYVEFADPVGFRRFDAVVMNPPFTLPGQRCAWAEHVALAWKLLLPGGQLRAIVPASLEYGRQRPIVAARAMITDAGGTWCPAPPGAFQASGTGVHTLIVAATKPHRRKETHNAGVR